MAVGAAAALDATARARSATKFGKEGLTFDDVLLVPAESGVLPNDVSHRHAADPHDRARDPDRLGGDGHGHRGRLAIALAREGGIGILHRNLSIADQVAEVDKVKRSESGMIVEPVTLPPDDLVADALELMARYHISGVPITDEDGILVGILTNRDLRFETNLRQPVSRADDLARTSSPRRSARRSTRRARSCTATRSRSCRSSTPTGGCEGLITVKDIRKRIEFPLATKDEQGRLRVGAAVGVGAGRDRARRRARRRRRRRPRGRHRPRPLARRSSRW